MRDGINARRLRQGLPGSVRGMWLNGRRGRTGVEATAASTPVRPAGRGDPAPGRDRGRDRRRQLGRRTPGARGLQRRRRRIGVGHRRALLHDRHPLDDRLRRHHTGHRRGAPHQRVARHADAFPLRPGAHRHHHPGAHRAVAGADQRLPLEVTSERPRHRLRLRHQGPQRHPRPPSERSGPRPGRRHRDRPRGDRERSGRRTRDHPRSLRQRLRVEGSRGTSRTSRDHRRRP